MVADVTTEERRVLDTPSARERRSTNPKMTSANQLITAYKISAKDPATFYPIIVFIAKEGAFLTDDVRKTLADISASPEKPISKGGKGPLGNLQLEGTNEGGIYIGKVKRPSRDAAMLAPLEHMAMISVMHSASEPLEVRISFMAALEKGVDLKSIEGGERYFQSFRPPADGAEDNSAALREQIGKISTLILADADFPNAPTQERPRIQEEGNSLNVATKGRSSETVPSQPAKKGWVIWVVFGTITLFLTLLFILRKKRQ